MHLINVNDGVEALRPRGAERLIRHRRSHLRLLKPVPRRKMPQIEKRGLEACLMHHGFQAIDGGK